MRQLIGAIAWGGISLLLAAPACAAAPEIVALAVDPPEVRLRGVDAGAQLLVEGRTAGGELVDLTAAATFVSQDAAVATVAGRGRVLTHGDGTTVVEVRAAGRTARVAVHSAQSQVREPLNFARDVVPVFSKFGCNGSGCHGKAEGQNGFKLSVFGSDPRADFAALVQESRGRRVTPSQPEQSLLLVKANGGVPHGGGVRILRDSGEQRLLRDWIAAGLPYGADADPQVVSVAVTPQERLLRFGDRRQLRVVATYSDGAQRDVTPHARFQSNREALAKVDEQGLVTVGDVPGEVTIMAAYADALDVFRGQIPQPAGGEAWPPRPVYNFIDELVDAKLRKLNIAAADVCGDADFVRRVQLDLIGALPTADEARAFLADGRSDKRARLVEALLDRPEFADYWALQWADLLRVDRTALGHKGAYQYYRWIRERIASHQPFDQFARDVLTAAGPLNDAPAGQLYKAVKDPGDVASLVSQVFLGVRIECARCHHHPFDRWSQDDYYGMQACFTQVGFKSSPRGEVLTALNPQATTHPRTGAVVLAHPLGQPAPTTPPAGDRRRLLADWLTAPDNPWFARNVANRLWAHFIGRGLVEPVDDVRLTNPPSNPELLDALARRFVEERFDVRGLMRTLCASRTYQLSSQPNASNQRDEQNASRALLKRLDAEVLLDALCQVTGVPEKFDGAPAGVRATQLWDSAAPHEFLQLFGRPQRATACECERQTEPSVAQVLMVLNSPNLQAKLSHAGGRVRRLVERFPHDDRGLVDEIYLTCYARPPTAEELQTAAAYLQNRGDRQRATEDLVWSLVNTPEFLFNH